MARWRAPRHLQFMPHADLPRPRTRRRTRRRPHGRARRRRGSRERGRSGARGRSRHARSHQLHGQAGPRPDLPDADARALRAAAPADDGQEQRHQVRHRVHGLDRSRAGRHHRHLGGRSRAHRASRSGARCETRRHRPARPHLPDPGAGRRRADARRPYRSRLRSGRDGRPHARGRDLRGDEGRRLDGAPARPRSLRAPARPEDRQHRRV